ncbi:MAG: hypothetical protein AB9846_16790 [Tenuifilaceae bacterium]
MKRILLFIPFLLLCISSLMAQNTCTDQLRVAQRRFDDGLLDEIPQLLAACMKDGFTDEEKTNAYKLLIQTYLYNEQPEKADEVMLHFLREFPDYALAQNDPKEFTNLHKTYRTDPIFKIEAKLNGSLAMPAIVEPNGVNNLETSTAGYSPKIGGGAEFNYIDDLYKDFDYSIGVSFLFSRLGYSSKPLDFATLTGIYTEMYVGIPLSVRYNFMYKGISFFVRAGIEPTYLISSSIQLTRKDNIPARPDPITGTEDLTSLHRRIDIKPSLAFGPTIKFGRGQLRFSIEMKFGTLYQMNEENKYKEEDLFNKYKFVEDQLRFSQANISLSYIRPIYQPKKIR